MSISPSMPNEEPSQPVQESVVETGQHVQDEEPASTKSNEIVEYGNVVDDFSNTTSPVQDTPDHSEDVSVPQQHPSADVEAHLEIEKNEGTAIAYLQQIVRRMVDGHELPEHYVDACVRRFAPPNNIGEAEGKLHQNNVVVVIAEQDTGRHDLAVYLLNSCRGVARREFRREPGDPLEINELDVKRETSWLLDLRNESKLQHYFGRSLLSVRQHLKTRSSYLVVVLSPSLWASSGEGAEGIEFRPSFVPRADIVKAQLSAQERPIDAEPYLGDSRIARSLENASTSEAIRWTETLRKVGVLSKEELLEVKKSELDSSESDKLDTSDPDVEKLRIEAALKIHADWRKELLEVHLKHEDSRVRNFLLASAVLEGRPSGDIFEASRDLAVKLGEEAPDTQGLRGPGIVELAHHIGAELREDKYLKFSRPGYASAVLNYFWADREHLQRELITWMCEQAHKLNGAPGALADRIAEAVLRWTTEREDLGVLRDVVKRFAADARYRELLVDLTTVVALRDDSLGQNVRQQLLSWARNDQPAIKSIVADVCGGELARLRPAVSLFRLGELTEDSDTDVVDRVRESIRSMWAHPEVRDRIVKRVVSWCTDKEPERRKPGSQVFLALAEICEQGTGIPELISFGLERNAQMGDMLARGWYGILTMRPSLSPQVLALWVAAANHSIAALELLKSTLASAVVGFNEMDTDERRYAFLAKALYSSVAITPGRQECDQGEIKEEIITHVTSALRQAGRAPVYADRAGEAIRPYE